MTTRRFGEDRRSVDALTRLACCGNSAAWRMPDTDAKAARELYEALWSGGELEWLDALIGRGYPGTPRAPSRCRPRGWALRAGVATRFSDLRVAVGEQLQEDDRVVSRLASGHPRRPLCGCPRRGARSSCRSIPDAAAAGRPHHRGVAGVDRRCLSSSSAWSRCSHDRFGQGRRAALHRRTDQPLRPDLIDELCAPDHALYHPALPHWSTARCCGSR